MKEDNFSTYHPLVEIIYFIFVIGVSMFFMHPVFLGISLGSGIIYSAILIGVRKTLKNNLLLTLPLIIIVALINPLFNHYGVTTLFYLNNGNPVTLESMVYGVVMAVMMCTVILWFASYTQIMTSDKFLYLFGKIIPALSLLLSMCLRFVPRLRERTKVISNGQKCIGRDVSNGGLIKKIKQGIKIMSILITWALENAIETADSMKARGYGLSGRTAFSIYRLEKRDIEVLSLMGILAGIFFWGNANGYTFIEYNPRIVIKGLPINLQSGLIFGSYLTFCIIPIVVDCYDSLRWKMLRRQTGKQKEGGYRLWTC